MTGLRLGARLWWGLIPLLLLLWGSGALLVSSIPGIPTSPLSTLIALPAAQFARDVAMSIALGGLALGLVVKGSAGISRTTSWAAAWLAAWLGLSAVSMAAFHGDVAATTVLGFAQGSTFVEVITGTGPGRALAVQAACVLVSLILIALPRKPWAWRASLGIALIGAAAPAFAGHAGLSGEHSAAAISIALHVPAMALWVGGLAVVVGLVATGTTPADEILPRFSVIALVCVIVVAETGLLSATLTVGSLADLVGTLYGSLVLAKAALLAWLIRLGWLQRRKVVDQLPDTRVSLTLARVAGIELLIMGGALAAAVTMSRIGPSPIPGRGFAPLALLVLAVLAPIAIAQWAPKGWRLANAFPEAMVFVLLVAIVEVGGVGLLRVLAGTFGLLLECGVLIVIGWLAVAAARTRRSATVLIAIGSPIAIVIASLLASRMAG